MTAAALNISSSGTESIFILYDRLLHVSGFSGTNTGAQAVGGSLTRNVTGSGNQIWVEIYTQIGATPTTITASYTDQDGNSGQTTAAAAIGGTNDREPQHMIQLPLADGDDGVQAVASVTLAGSTGTVGDFGVTVVRPLLVVHLALNAQGNARDLIAGIPSFVEIDSGACLAFMYQAMDTNDNQFLGTLQFVEK
jgi:hypothetical protein